MSEHRPTVAQAATLIDRHLAAAARHNEAAIRLRAYIAQQGRNEPSSQAPSRPTDFTAAQQKIALLLLAGRTRTEMAHELFVSMTTVASHLRKIYNKLGVRDRDSAIRVLAAMGPPP